MLTAISDQGVNIAEVINCEQFSSAFRLLKTTALVFQVVQSFLAKIRRTCQVIPNVRAYDFDQARIIWLRQMQSQLQECSKSPSWKQQFYLLLVNQTYGDVMARHAHVTMQTKTGRSTVFQHPVQLLYPLEINCQPRSNSNQDDASTTTTAGSLMDLLLTVMPVKISGVIPRELLQ